MAFIRRSFNKSRLVHSLNISKRYKWLTRYRRDEFVAGTRLRWTAYVYMYEYIIRVLTYICMCVTKDVMEVWIWVNWLLPYSGLASCHHNWYHWTQLFLYTCIFRIIYTYVYTCSMYKHMYIDEQIHTLATSGWCRWSNLKVSHS